MKQFFKFMFASMLGFILTFVIIFFIFFIIIIAIASSAKKEDVVTVKNTVIHVELNQPINDRTSENPFKSFDFSTMKSNASPGLNDILKSIKKAKTDEHVKGIYLDISVIPAGIATVEEIRNALIDFKTSKKFILAYSEVFTQKAYYLATVADKIYLNPAGMIDFRGLSAQIMFFKGALQKLEVEPQIIRHGKFKSAVEPFMLDKMSDANREQTLSFIQAIWNQILKGISEERKISLINLTSIADSVKIETPEDAIKYKFVDKLAYKDELLAEIRERLGLKEKDKIAFMSLAKYNKVPGNPGEDLKSKDKIAIVFAQGSIESGEGDDETIGSEKISKAIRDARLSENVKAIVLRVNSPGGSALASDVIWREVVLAKKAKPIVVSMGDVAASGGYYISCAANKIVASPNTITGSIGVFGVIPNLKGLFTNKLGITFDEVTTNKNSNFANTMRPMNDFEKKYMQRMIENIYSTFISHVAEGRNMTVAQVDSIGQGRVWSGTDAKRIGLIDEFGGLDKAIEIAAKLAKIEKYKIVSLPRQKDAFTQIIDDLKGNTKTSIIENELGDSYKYIDFIRKAEQMKGIQARLPYEISIE